jgi:hypothetical protein
MHIPMLVLATIGQIGQIGQVGQLRYVDIHAPAGGDGSSWAQAYNDLSAALADKHPVTEIWDGGWHLPRAGAQRL